MGLVTLLVKETGQRAVRGTCNTPWFVDRGPFGRALLSHKAIHATVEVRIHETVLGEKSKDTLVFPIAA